MELGKPLKLNALLKYNINYNEISCDFVVGILTENSNGNITGHWSL